jgi:prevent-host-death family protein
MGDLRPPEDDSSMSIEVTIEEAEQRLAELVDRAIEGKRIVIVRAGVPVAVLTGLYADRSARAPGRYAGQIVIRDDFDSPLSEFDLAD